MSEYYKIRIKPFGGEFSEDVSRVRWTNFDAVMTWAKDLFMEPSIEEVRIHAAHLVPTYISLRRVIGTPGDDND